MLDIVVDNRGWSTGIAMQEAEKLVVGAEEKVLS
jgi:hypothetical protein